MEQIKKICINCGKEFWIIEPEQVLLQKLELPHPAACPSCRQERRLRNRGERSLFKSTCQNCGKNIIVTYDPNRESRKILCKSCYLEWFEKNPVLSEN